MTSLDYMRSFPHQPYPMSKRTEVGPSEVPTQLLNMEDAIRLVQHLRALPHDMEGEIEFDKRKAGVVKIEFGERFVKLEPWARESLSNHRLLPWRG